MIMIRMSRPDRAGAGTSGRCGPRRTTTVGSTASSATRSRGRLRALRVRQLRIFPLKRYRVSVAHFVEVRLRPRRDRHGVGAQTRETEGEVVGTEKAERAMNLIFRQTSVVC